MKYFHGEIETGPYFEGWYFRCQTKDGTGLALIPAWHIDGQGKKAASIQFITEDISYALEFPGECLVAQKDSLRIEIAENCFSHEGIVLDICRGNLRVTGNMTFGPLLPLGSDIMGPFRFLPGMECRHSVFSMQHMLSGNVTINGTKLDFTGGMGYIEGDRGTSFPKRYLWTQVGWENGSFMLSIAQIPVGGIRFTGCVCALVLDGQEYRFATYRGARVAQWREDFVLIRQGRFRIQVRLLAQNPRPLRAPISGEMKRTVHECIRSRVHILIREGDRVLTDRITDRAAYEFSQT